MTTNKPEVVLVYRTDTGGTVKMVCLTDYEALQVEYEKLLKHLQNLIDQTTPLEPEPGNPMWSRRIQLDEVIAERDSLRAECDALRAKTSMSIGVGDGTGNLFVHGDYNSIKRVQELIFECEKLVESLREIAAWPDGGSTYGQEKIKAFANATLEAYYKGVKT